MIGTLLQTSPPNMIFTRVMMESLLGSYGCSLLGISRIAGIGCKTTAEASHVLPQMSTCNHHLGPRLCCEGQIGLPGTVLLTAV